MLYEYKDLQSRAANGENQRGEKGQGGMARGGRKGCPSISPMRAGKTYTLLDAQGSGMVRHIWCTFPPGDPKILRNLILRMYWDGQAQPSVEVPLGDFFGLPHGAARDLQSEYVQVNGGTAYNCWIPMPFRTGARITVENDSGMDVQHLFYQVDYTLGDEIPENACYFHAQFRRQNPCPMHQDYEILRTSGRGVYLGTVLGVRSLYTESWWGEGEMKFYLDGDKDYPTICGTGTEDYIGFAWGMTERCTPQAGCPLCDDERGRYAIYRFHGRDPIYFAKELRLTVQQIGWRPRRPLARMRTSTAPGARRRTLKPATTSAATTTAPRPIGTRRCPRPPSRSCRTAPRARRTCDGAQNLWLTDGENGSIMQAIE